MAESGFRRVAVLCCVAACFSLLAVKVFVPMATRETPHSGQGAPRQFPKQTPQRPLGPQPERPRMGGSHIPEARARHHANSQPATSNRSIMGQVLPVYCLGIFIYVVYILFKITTRKDGSQPKKLVKCLSGSGLSEHQLIQLKQRLEDTERALEKLASKVGPFSDGRSGGEQEERLLSQLQEIARTLRESTDFAGVDLPGGGTHPQHDSTGGECPGHQAAAEGEHSPSVEEAGTAVCAEGSTETPTVHTQLGETMGPTSKSDRCDDSNDVDAKDHDAGYEQSHVTAHCTGVRGPSEMEVENLSPDVGGPSETDEGRDGSGEEFKQHADEQTSGVRKRIAASMEKM